MKLIGIQASPLLYLTIHKAYHSFVMHFSLLFAVSFFVMICVCVSYSVRPNVDDINLSLFFQFYIMFYFILFVLSIKIFTSLNE